MINLKQLSDDVAIDTLLANLQSAFDTATNDNQRYLISSFYYKVKYQWRNETHDLYRAIMQVTPDAE